MKKSISLLTMLVMVMAMMFTLLSACGDPYRDDCKDACAKMYECDDEDKGGSGALDLSWLTSCQNSCDEADEIDDTMAKCINNTACEDLASDCDTGATTL